MSNASNSAIQWDFCIHINSPVSILFFTTRSHFDHSKQQSNLFKLSLFKLFSIFEMSRAQVQKRSPGGGCIVMKSPGGGCVVMKSPLPNGCVVTRTPGAGCDIMKRSPGGGCVLMKSPGGGCVVMNTADI
ncbi:hypothetical protein PENCOP_c002G04017 [Penicillium coprophilum]|uniref:Uncharacterized protein n=1 Tax=Penicillium coprophilum TaxID=36646 RepID=A0A1V6V0D3_9EURO|nr:hypothetical protein PENCOP_c002G04017 [Penicillium coprophilum]